ncbi:MAG: NAD-dependent epimerase/dehydratase family protein [Anaerolineales bacterium]
MAMSILVTGGTGFTGSHLVRRLISDGHKVRVLDNQPGLFHEELTHAGAEIVLGSVTDSELVENTAEGVDVIFHLAAAFRVINVPDEVYWDVNVNGTRNVFKAAVKAKVSKIIYCSTCGVHGDVKAPPGNEAAPIAPADYYQYTKYKGEEVAQEYISAGMDATIIRPAAIYGPGDPERWLILFRRVRSGWFVMLGNGKTTYHPVYIDNLVDSFLLSMQRPEAKGETYLIADEDYFSLNDLVRKVGESMGVKVKIIRLPFWPAWLAAIAIEMLYKPFKIDPPVFRRRIDWFRQDRAFDISKAKQELGYAPEIDLSEGLRRTEVWYRQNEYL